MMQSTSRVLALHVAAGSLSWWFPVINLHRTMRCTKCAAAVTKTAGIACQKQGVTLKDPQYGKQCSGGKVTGGR